MAVGQSIGKGYWNMIARTPSFLAASVVGFLVALMLPACGANGANGANGAPDGHACSADSDCASGACVPMAGAPFRGDGSINGTCGSPQPDGAPCGGNAECAAGVCDGATQTCGAEPNGAACAVDKDCTSGICAGQGTNPDCLGMCATGSCGVRAFGKACGRDKDCASGLCVTSAASDTGICGPLADGATCDVDADCTSGICVTDVAVHVCVSPQPDGSACVSPLGCMSGMCTANRCGGPLPNGSNCGQDSDCLSGSCIQDGRCAEPLGGPCSTDKDCWPFASQPGDPVCNGGKCQNPAADGTTCTEAQDCTSGICVDGTCGLRPNGEMCSGDSACQSGYCGNEICAAKQPNGSTCPDDSGCQSGYCHAGTCAAALGNGQSCTQNGECVSGMCDGGVCTCIGPNSGTGETTTPNACCSGSSTAYTYANDPGQSTCGGVCDNGACCAGWSCVGGPDGACVASNANDGYYACTPSLGITCTVAAQCDPGTTCGGSGTCCALTGGTVAGPTQCCSGVSAGSTCTCSTPGIACKGGAECCSTTCSGGTCQ